MTDVVRGFGEYSFQPDVIDLEDKSYTYDDVGNITQIAQDIRTSESILGGRYTTEYTYDTQNRLLTASQQSTSLGAYDYSMSYSRAGCVSQKQCLANNTSLTYGYQVERNRLVSHQVAGIYDGLTQMITRLNWDQDGQLSSMYGPCFDGLRQLRWNEGGQLVASFGDGAGAYFGYDGNGERVYKLRGNMTVEQINAGAEIVSLFFTYPTLYVNPYMVITPQGYTKYYYSGKEHVATQIGNVSHMQAQFTQSDTIAGMISKSNTFMQSAIGVSDSYTERPPILYTASGSRIVGQLGPHCSTTLLRVISTSSLQNQLLPVISGDVSGMETDPLEPALYYYHPDHLGSATWITDSLGNPAQFLQYLPYGEIWRNQQRMGYDERYKYSGKERDNETGYDYFGARHYTSAISGWLSPDPLMDKYPGISPYAYCNWNPMKYVDPDGTKIVVGTWYGRILSKFGVNNFEAKTLRRLHYLKTISPELNKAISTMEANKDVTVQIFPMSQFQKDYPQCDFNKGNTIKDGTNSSIYYNEDVGFIVDGDYSSPDAIMAHELGHAENNMNGTSITYNVDEAQKTNGNIAEKLRGNANEKKSIYYENQVRQKEGEPARSYDYYKANKEE